MGFLALVVKFIHVIFGIIVSKSLYIHFHSGKKYKPKLWRGSGERATLASGFCCSLMMHMLDKKVEARGRSWLLEVKKPNLSPTALMKSSFS